MENKLIQVILSNEAEDFVRLQPLKTQQKITYNIRKLKTPAKEIEKAESIRKEYFNNKNNEL